MITMLADKLALKPLVEPSTFDWRMATKTKPIRAKLIDLILVDPSVVEKFLLDTLEGNQSIKAGSMMCIGIGNDAWQQKKAKLFEKYNVTDIDKDGWMTCVPKPDNAVKSFEITDDMCGPEGFTLIGQWGEDHVLEGRKVYLQYGHSGDFVCQNDTDATDNWIVAKKMFLSTYEIKD